MSSSQSEPCNLDVSSAISERFRSRNCLLLHGERHSNVQWSAGERKVVEKFGSRAQTITTPPSKNGYPSNRSPIEVSGDHCRLCMYFFIGRKCTSIYLENKIEHHLFWSVWTLVGTHKQNEAHAYTNANIQQHIQRHNHALLHNN